MIYFISELFEESDLCQGGAHNLNQAEPAREEAQLE